MIGLYGATGNIGGNALKFLLDMFPGEKIKVGTRDPLKCAEESENVICVKTDIYDDEERKLFLRDCDCILNCAGPSFDITPLLIKEAIRNKIPLVDVGTISDKDCDDFSRITPDAPIIYGAGSVPGITGIFPIEAVANIPKGAEDVNLYEIYEVSGSFSKNGAVDYLTGLKKGMAGAATAISKIYKDNNSLINRLKAHKKAEVPGFPYPVRLFPYWDKETSYVSDTADKKNAEFYSAIRGEEFLKFSENDISDLFRGKADIESLALKLSEATRNDTKENGEYIRLVVLVEYTLAGERKSEIQKTLLSKQPEVTAATAVSVLKDIREKKIRNMIAPLYASGIVGIADKLRTLNMIKDI